MTDERVRAAARELVRELLESVDAPDAVRDCDGDVWTRRDDGLYESPGVSRAYTIRHLRDHAGPLKEMREPEPDAIVISSEAGWSKPNSQFFAYACKLLGENDRDKMLMIGDTLQTDINGARQAGLHARHLIDRDEGSLMRITKDL